MLLHDTIDFRELVAVKVLADGDRREHAMAHRVAVRGKFGLEEPGVDLGSFGEQVKAAVYLAVGVHVVLSLGGVDRPRGGVRARVISLHL